ncbi:MAG: hypothetical protein KDB14_00385 [Planctomycetales bacterium]|nr:hypothetical protein [Planctomycetales bacterium]
MQRVHPISNRVLAGGIALSVLLVIVAAWLPDTSLSATLRLSLTCAGLGMAIGLSWWSYWLLLQHQEEARCALARLTQMDEMDLLSGCVDELPKVSALNKWSDVCEGLATKLAESAKLTFGAESGKAEAELRVHQLDNQRRRATDVVAALPVPIVAINQYDEVVLSNHAAAELFGWKDVPLGRALGEVSPSAQLTELLTSVRCRGGPGTRTLELNWGEDHHQRHYRATCRSLSERQEQSVGAVVVMENISDRRALQQRNAEFVSAASHEIKAPLAGIKAYVELLADGDVHDDASRDEFVQVIDDQAERLQRLIDNLLDLARMEAGVESVRKSGGPLNEVLEEALRVVTPAAEQKQLQLVSDLSPMYLSVMADRDMLLQAAINLLSNAVKYTEAGGQIFVRSRLEDSLISFEVQDTGIGLSEEDCRRVFEKFYRASNGNMAPGTGLGLTLAKHIVEDVHGGRLSVSSELGTGTVFRVTLPRHVQS